MIKALVLTVMLALAGSSFAKENEPKQERKGPPPAEKVFGMMDANGDGCLSLDEFKAGRERMMKHEQERRQQADKPEGRGKGPAEGKGRQGK